MGIISGITVRLLRAQPFESEALDKLAETMKATPILKRDKLHRYYKSSVLPICCLAYSDALVFNSMYYEMLLPDEILAVGAHEFNHIAKKHVVKRLPRTVLPALTLSIVIGYLSSINSTLINIIQLFINFDRGLLIASTTVLFFLVFLVASFYVNAKWLSRQETECDISAAEFVNCEAVVSALAKIPHKTSSRESKLSKLLPHTHPSIEQRIKDVQAARTFKSN